MPIKESALDAARKRLREGEECLNLLITAMEGMRLNGDGRAVGLLDQARAAIGAVKAARVELTEE
jgi:hypothetical protein